MAAGDYFIGHPTCIGWALQAVASGTSWDGTPGTARYMKPVSGNMNIAFGADQNFDDTMDVDPASITTGATKVSGSFQVLLSYEHQELLGIGILCGDDAEAGAGPYTHTPPLADQLKYLTLYYYYEDFKTVRHLRTVTNAVITNFTITASAEARPMLSVSWVGQSQALTTPGADPTLNTADLVDWDELTATINGVARCASSVTFTVDQPVDDSDVGMCSDAPNVNTIFRSGPRTAQLSVEMGLDSTIDAILDAPSTALSTNSLAWNNGGAGAAERDITITMTSLYQNQHDTQIATWGKRRESLNYSVLGWGIVWTNSLSAAQV